MTAKQPGKNPGPVHQFHELLLSEYSSSEDFLNALLELGREILAMPCGILSRTHGQDYEILACSPTSSDRYPGAHFTMGRTFSTEALEGEGTVSLLAEPGVEGSWAHPAYQSESLRAFIGTPLHVRGRLFGTLDFCDSSDRDEAFTAEEIELIELLARAANQSLERDFLERERQTALENMEQHISLFESAFNNAAFGMALISPEGRTLRVNEALRRMLGYSEAEFLNMDLDTITHPDDQASDQHHAKAILENRESSYRQKKRFFHMDGSIVWCLIAASVVQDSQTDSPLHLIVQIEDITAQIHAENALRVRQRQLETVNRQLEQLARTDALTGLANRREFLERMDMELKRSARNDQPLSVMLIDVDHFKAFNDSFGHPEGDRALKEVASALRYACRETDLMVRYGGEEFAALLPETDMEGGFLIAERIRQAVENIDSLPREVSASIGVATTGQSRYRRHHDPDLEIAAVLEAADQALYRAKKSGRNLVKKAVGF